MSNTLSVFAIHLKDENLMKGRNEFKNGKIVHEEKIEVMTKSFLKIIPKKSCSNIEALVRNANSRDKSSPTILVSRLSHPKKGIISNLIIKCSSKE